METLCLLNGNNGTSFEKLGFKNLPNGRWQIKVGSKSITSKDETIIPICGSLTKRVDWSTTNFTWGSQEGSGWATINGRNALYVHFYYSSQQGWGSRSVMSTASTNYLYLPYFYDNDMVATQNGYTNGTLTCWLERIS